MRKDKENMTDNIKLSIEDMNLYYGAFHALKNINMHIPEKRSQLLSDPVAAANLHC